MKTLHLVLRDPNGRIEYQAIGHAIVAVALCAPRLSCSVRWIKNGYDHDETD